jgi:hypothetical protein
MKSLLTVVAMLAVVIPLTSALAQDSSPYVVGDWRFNDSTTAVTTVNTEFIFVNPTDLTLTLEYAFFAPDGTFCGCDRDTLKPNGRTRYTMADEVSGGQFSTTLCPSQTEGELKSIVFVSEDKKGVVVFGDAAQGGIQIHIFSNPADKSESNLQGIAVNQATTREINGIHQQCKKFIH